MKLILFLVGLVFMNPNAFAQEDNLESLTLPDEKPISSTSKGTDLSLPVEGTATSKVVKSNPAIDPKKQKESTGAILDFEGEVIEGERRRPDLFLQISIDNIKFDSLIYNRDDFNDYLEVDRKSRTRFLKMK